MASGMFLEFDTRHHVAVNLLGLGTMLVLPIERFMYLFMVVLQACIFFPKTHFGSRGYSFGLLLLLFLVCMKSAFQRFAHAFITSGDVTLSQFHVMDKHCI